MRADTVDAVFAALADGNRRGLLRRIAERGAATTTELASELPVTRQAVAKHLASLVRAGLVRGERRGRETRYELTPAPLGEAMAWLTSVGAEWDARLSALSAHLQSER
jgi:DNA-binding transcriptional ArsR family regulator